MEGLGFVFKNFTIYTDINSNLIGDKEYVILSQTVIHNPSLTRFLANTEFITKFGYKANLIGGYNPNIFKLKFTFNNDILKSQSQDTYYYITAHISNTVFSKPSISFMFTISFLELYFEYLKDDIDFTSNYKIKMFDINELLFVVLLKYFSDKRVISYKSTTYRLVEIFTDNDLQKNHYIQILKNKLLQKSNQTEFVNKLIEKLYEGTFTFYNNLSIYINDLTTITKNTQYLEYPLDKTEYKTFLSKDHFNNIHTFIFNRSKNITYESINFSSYTDERKLKILKLMNGSLNIHKPNSGIIYAKNYIASHFTKIESSGEYTVVESDAKSSTKTLDELIESIFEKTIHFIMHLYY